MLTVEYDRDTNSEVIMNKDLADILVVNYNQAGQPVEIIPDQPLEGLNITYDRQGHLTNWHRGDMSVSNVYDEESGHLVEQRLSGRATYRFLYKGSNKV